MEPTGIADPHAVDITVRYVFVLFMNDEDRVARMYKIWNAHWAMEQLGWA